MVRIKNNTIEILAILITNLTEVIGTWAFLIFKSDMIVVFMVKDKNDTLIKSIILLVSNKL